MRDTGEVHRDRDLRPTTKMTNANVASVVSMGKDRIPTVQCKGGEEQVLIPAGAARVNVGLNGQVPPM